MFLPGLLDGSKVLAIFAGWAGVLAWDVAVMEGAHGVTTFAS